MEKNQPNWVEAPEGATHWGPENESYCEAWYKVSGGRVVSYLLADSAPEAMEPADAGEFFYHHIDDLVERPSVWTGEGLPPVGAVCEALWDTARDEWFQVKIFGVNEHGQPVFRWEDGPEKYQYQAGTLTGPMGHKHFRPIRTPEQIAAEEREKAVLAIGQILIDNREYCNEYNLARLIYDAGFHK